MIAAIKEDIIAGADGFYIFWPEGRKGSYAAHHLRLIADILDEMNEPLWKDIEDFFSKSEREETPTDT